MVGVTRAYIGYLYLDDRYPYGRHRLQYIQFHLTWNGRGWNVYYELRERASERENGRPNTKEWIVTEQGRQAEYEKTRLFGLASLSKDKHGS